MFEGQEEGAFAARIAEILGDAYVALDRGVDARDAYQRALAESGSSATVDQQFVQLKLLDLPVEVFPNDEATE
jgi:predicted negative regulator of RcsB-dependent stress response